MNPISILVTYNPDFSQLQQTLSSLCPQVSKVIIVDNGDTVFDTIPENCDVIHLHKNFGIAYAQNRGIEKAVEFGADWVLLSDQDTIYPENYVSDMLEKSSGLEKVGALCPVFFDEVKKIYSNVMVSKMKGVQPESGKIYKIAHSISSGTFIPISVLQIAGFMREDFFIDFVDFEWCWRLEKFDLNIYCISDVVIHHQLGDKMKRRFWMNIVYRSLFRFYYIIRNGYYLLTTDYLKGKDRFLFKLLMKKKIMEVLFLNDFSRESFSVVKNAVRAGKNKKFVNYEEMDK